tara:strand:- start:249 stop:1112 length:864 start_codon:yes stop_codon:yes gene_type:complete
VKQNLPNLLIPGYHKSGTTTLFNELSKHSDICPSIIKEPFYFRPFINGKKLPPLKDYKKYFRNASNERYLMDGSPTYIYGGKRAAEIIQKTLGNVKIIICLRDPVNQLFSLYKHHLRFMKCNENETFLSFVQRKNDFSKQFYDEHLKEWFRVFGDDIKCIFFEQFIETPNVVLADIYNWLGISPLLIENRQLINANPGKMFRFASLHSISLKLFKLIKNKISNDTFILFRKIYFNINGKEAHHSLTKDAKLILEPIFYPHLRELKTTLKLQEYQNMPKWLSTINDKE